MSQELNSTISGSIYDRYIATSQGYKENRMPRVGQKCEFEDGRKFIFCSTAVDIIAGGTVSAPEPVEFTGVTVAAIGTRTIVTESTTIAANAWAGGLMVCILGTGAGYTYKIKSNTVASSSASTITLYDPLKVALAATDDITIVPLRANSVIVGIEAGDPVGVANVVTSAGTDGVTQWFWVQYAGICWGAAVQETSGEGLMVGAGDLIVVDAAGFQVGVSVEAGGTNGVANICFPT